MFNITKIREYNIWQIISTIAVHVFALLMLVDLRTDQKYLYFNFEIILTLTIVGCVKSFYDGKSRFIIARTRESNYFEGNKSNIVNLLLLMGVVFMYLMLAGLNTIILNNVVISNLLATLAGILLFLPFMHYDEESDIQDIHTLKTVYLSRGEAIFYRIFLYVVSTIVGIIVSILLSIQITSNENTSNIYVLVIFILWMIFTSRLINKLTIAGK